MCLKIVLQAWQKSPKNCPKSEQQVVPKPIKIGSRNWHQTSHEKNIKNWCIWGSGPWVWYGIYRTNSMFALLHRVTEKAPKTDAKRSQNWSHGPLKTSSENDVKKRVKQNTIFEKFRVQRGSPKHPKIVKKLSLEGSWETPWIQGVPQVAQVTSRGWFFVDLLTFLGDFMTMFCCFLCLVFDMLALWLLCSITGFWFSVHTFEGVVTFVG